MTCPSHTTSEHYHTSQANIVHSIAQSPHKQQTLYALLGHRAPKNFYGPTKIPAEGDANDN